MSLELGGGCYPGHSLIPLGYFFLCTSTMVALECIPGAVLWGMINA